ncbi:hypothetical protein D3C73_1062980 [compost metagenome]
MRGVVGEGVAAAGFKGAHHFRHLVDHHGLEFDAVGTEPVGKIQFGGGAGLHADGGAVEFLGAFHAQLLVDQDALAVIEAGGHGGQPQGRVARLGQRDGAQQHIDFAGLQRGEALLGRQRRAFEFGRITEHGRRHRAADVHVHAFPFALAVGGREPGDAVGQAALHESLFLHRIQGGAGKRRLGRARQGQSAGCKPR